MRNEANPDWRMFVRARLLRVRFVRAGLVRARLWFLLEPRDVCALSKLLLQPQRRWLP